jgi:threonylcarbamoyladenosine tRNA methylthiotransferase MtaB
VATGCYAERASSELAGIEGVGLVAGNRDKVRLVELVDGRTVGRRASGRAGRPGSCQLRTRALVQIQAGCSQACSFCVVPRTRGPEGSRPEDEVVAEVKSRVAEGCKEVVLTGTRIGRYGQNGGLRGLIKRILDESDVKRLRLSSLEPSDITPELLRLWEDRRLCPHVHMPLQSGSDPVLDRMGRPYSASDFQRAASLAREAVPGLALTTDIMVGFPGESESEFKQSYDFCRCIGFAAMHVFPYSARPGTRAAEMPDTVGDRKRKQRSLMMLDLARRSALEFRKRFVGDRAEVLWERQKGGVWAGLSDNYLRVFARCKKPLSNRLLAADLVAARDDGLWGEIHNPEA